jgi:hypothetical protein
MVMTMNGLGAALVVVALLAVPFGLAGGAVAADRDGRDLTPIVVTGGTDRLGGGGVVAVKAGDTLFGVRYGTAEHPGNLVIFAEYTRYLGIADIVDNQGNYLQTRGIPVVTVIGQSLDGFIEFEDRDGDGLLNFYDVDRNGTIVRTDVPVKGLLLNASWALDGPTREVVDNTTYVNFTLAATGLPYGRHFDGVPGTEVLDRLAFTFHLTVDVVSRSGQVPAYRVSVDDGNERVVSHVEYLGMRNVSGRAVAMGAKYDHAIDGWDFANGANLLALETHLLFANHVPGQVSRFVHMAYFRDHSENETGTDRHNETTTDERPRLYTQDRIYFDDDWTRVGRFEWQSNVTVDGRDTTMSFQVQGARPLDLRHGLTEFRGLAVRGAFIYPNGGSIFHDPAMVTESLVLDLPTGVNVTPLTILAVQLGLVAFALGPAVYLRAKARRAK